MATFNGLEVMTSLYLTDPMEQTVARTWRERLWSWPWRPWVAMKTVTVQVPSSRVLHLNGKLLMHPATLDVLRQQVGVSHG